MKDFFKIRAIAGVIVLELYGEFYQWDMFEDFLRWQIAEFGSDAPMTIRVSSPGGDPRVGIALYGIIKNHKGPTTGYIEYMCDSSATLPMCACDTVIANRLPFEYMIHDPKLAMDWSTVEEGQAMVDLLDQIRDQMADIYVEKTGQSEENIKKWMRETKFMKAEEALQFGFIDEIKEVDQTLEAKVDYELAASKHADHRPKDFTIEGRGTSPATSNNNKKQKTMSEQKPWLSAKLKALFGKGDDVEDQDLYLESKELKANNDSLKADLSAKDEEIATLKAEVEELKSNLPSEEDEEKEKNEQVEAELEAAVKLFKITAASKDNWKKRFEGKPDELKATLELIPENAMKGNSKVDQPNTKAQAGAGVHPKVAAAFGGK